MGRNYVWANRQETQTINEPFVGYVVQTNTMRNFGDWFLGVGGSSQNNGKYKTGRFGHLGDNQNYLKNLMSVTNNYANKNMTLADIESRHILNVLEKIKEEALKKEQRFYQAFNCTDINSFRNFWAGHFQEMTTEDYWVYKVTSYFTGENTRLIGSKNRTEFEKLTSLTAIQLDQIKTEGIEDEKNNLKRDLTTGVDQVLKELKVGEQGNNSQWDIFVSKNGIASEDFLGVVFDRIESDLAKNELEQKMTEAQVGIRQALINTIQDLFGGTNGRFEVTETNIKNLRNRINDKGTYYKTLSAYFVNWRNPAKYKDQQKALFRNIVEFIDKIMAVHLPPGDKNTIPSWEAWQLERDKTIKIIEGLFKKFFIDHPEKKYSEYVVQVNNINAIQGLLGEFQTYIKNEYGKGKLIGNEKTTINVLNLANALNTKSKLSGVDILITLTDQGTGRTEGFGFQVKNPFQTKRGYYDTYKRTWHMGTNEMNTLYKNYFGWDENSSLRYSFEMLNANLKNSQNPNNIINTVKNILLLYAPQFMRLAMEKIEDSSLNKESQEILDLVGNQVQNSFFVLKGELIPVSDIIDGLIKQYQIVYNGAQKDSEQPVLKISYTNKNKMNAISPEEYNPKLISGNRFLYDPSKILVGSQYENALKQITFTTALRLKIPSIQELNHL